MEWVKPSLSEALHAHARLQDQRNLITFLGLFQQAEKSLDTWFPLCYTINKKKNSPDRIHFNGCGQAGFPGFNRLTYSHNGVYLNYANV